MHITLGHELLLKIQTDSSCLVQVAVMLMLMMLLRWYVVVVRDLVRRLPTHTPIALSFLQLLSILMILLTLLGMSVGRWRLGYWVVSQRQGWSCSSSRTCSTVMLRVRV